MNKRTRNFTVVFLPILLLCIVTLVEFLHSEARDYKTQIQENEARIVNLLTGILANGLNDVQGDLLYLSQKRLLANFVDGRVDLKRALAEDYVRFAEHRRVYGQIRLIAGSGEEVIRVNYHDGIAKIVSASDLQNKKSRYYFSATMRLPAGGVYVSPFDLNVEHNKIQEPRNPVIRFAVPLFDSQGGRWGMLILNFHGNKLLGLFNRIAANSHGDVWLLNRDGYWLVSPHLKDEWAFMFRDLRDQRLPVRDPGLWTLLSDGPGDTVSVDGTLYTYARICGETTCKSKSIPGSRVAMAFEAPDFPWTVVSRVANTGPLGLLLSSPQSRSLIPIGALLILIVTVVGWVAWRLANTVAALRGREHELHKSRVLLDAFFENNPAAMFVKSKMGTYLFANDACQKMLGTDHAVVGTDDNRHFPPEVVARLGAQDDAVAQEGRVIEFSNHFQDEHGDRYYSTIKFPLYNEAGVTEAVGGIATDVTEKLRANRALEQSEHKFKILLESAPDGIAIVNEDDRIVLVNKRTEELFSYDRGTLVSMRVDDLIQETDRERFRQFRFRQVRDPEGLGVSTGIELHGLREGGETFPIEVTLSPVQTERGPLNICNIRDISARMQLETQFRQSQKMEAIGLLSGGMAHDFNNLLGVVIGNLDILERLVRDDGQNLKRVHTAQKAALRGADLTKRMLAVARRQSLHPEPILVNDVIGELTQILPRTLGPDIEVVTKLAPSLPPVLVDRSGLENALLNLAVNARDAMPDGGRLYMRSETTHLDQGYVGVQNKEIPPGPYVRISVTDTGCGMTPDTVSRMFEPFFTTKDRGKGTGLGLAMIYGFTKQSHGHIRVYSELGEGTTVNIYAPAMEGVIESAGPIGKPAVNGLGGAETVLVVDDEVELLEIAVTYLEELGYKVHAAADAQHALDVLSTHSRIDLLLTDIIMPGGMNGVALAKAARTRLPTIRILYTSGFPSDALAEKSGLEIDAPIVTKPYRKDELAQRIRDTLA